MLMPMAYIKLQKNIFVKNIQYIIYKLLKSKKIIVYTMISYIIDEPEWI